MRHLRGAGQRAARHVTPLRAARGGDARAGDAPHGVHGHQADHRQRQVVAAYVPAAAEGFHGRHGVRPRCPAGAPRPRVGRARARPQRRPRRAAACRGSGPGAVRCRGPPSKIKAVVRHIFTTGAVLQTAVATRRATRPLPTVLCVLHASRARGTCLPKPRPLRGEAPRAALRRPPRRSVDLDGAVDGAHEPQAGQEAHGAGDDEEGV